MMKLSQKTQLFRAVVALPILGLAYFAGSGAIVSATRSAIPATALSVDSGDSVALATQADAKWAEAVTNGQIVDVSVKAKQALRAQAINPRAMRLLGYGADARGDRKRALELNMLAARLSRRESGAQLWLMENSVEHSDVPAVLARYDVLLSTNPGLQAQLFPKLALGLSDPEIRDAFVPYIRKTPAWLPGFLGAALNSPNPDALSYAIRKAGGLPKTEAYQPYVTGLLGGLFAKKKYAEARAFYNTLPGADAGLANSAAFTDAALDPKMAPMGWALESNADAGASLAKNGEEPVLQAFALSGASGLAASKYLFIAPGNYRFGSAQTVTVPSSNARASWMLRCMSSADNAAIYQYDIIRSARAAAPKDQVTIPASCQVQRLDLYLVGGDDSAGLELTVARVEIGR